MGTVRRVAAVALRVALRLIVRFPLAFILLALSGIGYVVHDRITTDVSELQLGDCFDLPAPAGGPAAAVSDAEHHPCNDAHLAEVILVGRLPGSSDRYPSARLFGTFIDAYCLPAFREYTGRSFAADADADYSLHLLAPNDEGWAEGDRTFRCFVERLDHRPMTATIRAPR